MENVEWGEFELGSLFEINSSKKIFHANQLNIFNKKILGSTPYAVRITGNNGVRGYIIEDDKYKNEGNTLSFAQDTFSVFFQKEPYYTGNKVKILKPLFLNKTENVLKYFALSLQYVLLSLSWGVGSTVESISKTKIQLPTKNGEIDFDFMESFIGELEKERIGQLESYLIATGLNDYKLTANERKAINEYNKLEWKEFKLGVLFERIKTKKLPFKAKELPGTSTDTHTLPCLTSSFNNQGLNYFAPKDEATILKNVISIPSNSDVYRSYFQSKPFTVLSDAYAIKWIFDSKKLLPNQYLFVVQCINKVTDLPIYSYKNKLGGWNVVKNKHIKLPVKNDKPDYESMNTLISAIKKQTIKNVVIYVEKKV